MGTASIFLSSCGNCGHMPHQSWAAPWHMLPAHGNVLLSRLTGCHLVLGRHDAVSPCRPCHSTCAGTRWRTWHHSSEPIRAMNNKDPLRHNLTPAPCAGATCFLWLVAEICYPSSMGGASWLPVTMAPWWKHGVLPVCVCGCLGNNKHSAYYTFRSPSKGDLKEGFATTTDRAFLQKSHFVWFLWFFSYPLVPISSNNRISPSRSGGKSLPLPCPGQCDTIALWVGKFRLPLRSICCCCCCCGWLMRWQSEGKNHSCKLLPLAPIVVLQRCSGKLP